MGCTCSTPACACACGREHAARSCPPEGGARRPIPLAIGDTPGRPAEATSGKRRFKLLRRNKNKVSSMDASDLFSQDVMGSPPTGRKQRRANPLNGKNGNEQSPTALEAAPTAVVAAPGTLTTVAKKPRARDLPPQIDLSRHRSRLPVEVIPEVVRAAIAAFMGPQDVFQSALVCRTWKDVFTAAVLWERVAAQKHPHALAMLKPVPGPNNELWRVYLRAAMRDPAANVMQNGYPTTLAEHAKGWRVLGGAKVAIEERTRGSADSSLELPPAAAASGKFNVWVGKKKVHRRQVVNLDAVHFPVYTLDREAPRAPTLRVCESFLPKGPTSQFRVRVRLMGEWKGVETPQEVLAEFDSGVIKAEGDAHAWRTIEHVFPSVKGVRFVSWEDWFTDADATSAGARFRLA